MEHTDVVCIGTGGVGSAAMWHLARRGLKVTGLDRFPPAHDRGSSHGRTRVIRLAYFEHPDYVPLLLRAYELWADLEEAAGRSLYSETGLLEVGPPNGQIVAGVRAAAARHGLEIQNVEAADVPRIFPGYSAAEGTEAVFERRAGILQVEDCVSAHLELAQADGAVLRTGVTVRGWSTSPGGGVIIDSDQGPIGADRLVVAAGAWAAGLLADLRLPLAVTRKSLFWFAADDRYSSSVGAPLFFYETPQGCFYGFPAHRTDDLKVANHSGGDRVADPLAVDRRMRQSDLAEVTGFLEANLPGVDTSAPSSHAVCMYTNTPDGHFIVDRHPDHPQVCFVAGLSGHGFKMANVLGEHLADLATGAAKPIDFLSASRFADGAFSST